MIENVHIQNFRCLRDVSVPLRPLTVLVGQNDSGKSAFLAALEAAAARRQPDLSDHWRFEPSAPPYVCLSGRLGRFHYRAGTWTDDGSGAFRSLRRVPVFRPPSTGVELSGPGITDQNLAPAIDADGRGVPALLDYLLRRDRDRFYEVVAAVKRWVPGVEDIHVGTPTPSERSVELKIDSGLVLPYQSVSVGVRLLLFFVVLTYHPDPPELILVEEPENGLHPRRLADIVSLLRDITQGAHGGRPAQVVLTTHSPYLLDRVDVETDQVLVFRRQEDGSRTAEPADAPRLRAFLDEFMLGEVWFNQQEQGLIKPTA